MKEYTVAISRKTGEELIINNCTKVLKKKDEIEKVWDTKIPKFKKDGIFKHYKNSQLYVLEDLVINNSDGEIYTVYKGLFGNLLSWTCPYKLFNINVDKKKYPNCKYKKEFTYIGDEIPNRRFYLIMNNVRDMGQPKVPMGKIERYLRKLRYIEGYILDRNYGDNRLVIKIDYDPKSYRETGLQSIGNTIEYLSNRKVISFIGGIKK